jgi:hypothetical protein
MLETNMIRGKLKGVRDMRHIRKLTNQPAMQKQSDEFGAIFLQVWLMVFSLILSAAFTDKGSRY